MEPENHLFEKEHHLPNLHVWVPMLIFAFHDPWRMKMGSFPCEFAIPWKL